MILDIVKLPSQLAMSLVFVVTENETANGWGKTQGTGKKSINGCSNPVTHGFELHTHNRIL